jgi:hypothetical protein
MSAKKSAKKSKIMIKLEDLQKKLKFQLKSQTKMKKKCAYLGRDLSDDAMHKQIDDDMDWEYERDPDRFKTPGYDLFDIMKNDLIEKYQDEYKQGREEQKHLPAYKLRLEKYTKSIAKIRTRIKKIKSSDGYKLSLLSLYV